MGMRWRADVVGLDAMCFIAILHGFGVGVIRYDRFGYKGSVFSFS